MTLSDIMTTPAPTIAADAQVSEVARIILDRGIAGMAVVDAQGAVLGIVTEDDLVAKHARVHAPLYLGILGGVLPFDTSRTDDEMRHVLAVTARDLMSKHDHRVDVAADIDDAASLMVEQHLDPLLVMSGEALVGILSKRDVIRLLLQEERDDGEDYQSS